MAPVRYKCRETRPFRHQPEKVYEICKWEVDEGVKAVTLECERTESRYVVTRNMDPARGEYPWRISRFHAPSDLPLGHAYGKDAASAMDTVGRWEKCKVVKVRTVSGAEDFGRYGKLTTTLRSSTPSHEARRVVAAFLRGETARGACKGKGAERACAITSDGRTLQVTGMTVASRDGGRITVCVPPETSMTRKGRHAYESEEAKDVRVTASMLLRRVAGIGVQTNAEGQRLLSARGRAALLMPAACVQVRIPKKQVSLVLTTTSAVDAAKARFNTPNPTKRQVEKMRALLVAEQRTQALVKANATRKPAEAVFPPEEYAPTVEAPEAPPQEAPFYPEPEEPAYEDETFQWEEGPPPLPKDVEHPTNPESYTRFVTEYIPKLRKSVKRDMALAWQAYLLDPKNALRPTSKVVNSKSVPENIVRAAREVELEIADEYGIVDPIYGYIAPDVAHRTAVQAAGRKRATATRNRKGKGRESNVDPNAVEHMRWLRKGQRLVDPETHYFKK